MITVIGSANVDYVIHTERMPKMGETVVGGDFQINAGGKGLNQAVAVSKLGGEVAFFAMLGADAGGAMLENALSEHGVRFEGECVSETHTGIAMITVVNGDNAIILHAGANDLLTSDIVRKHEELIAQSEYVVLQLEIPLAAVETVCELAVAHGKKVVFNPAPFKSLSAKILHAVDWLIPNEHEAAALVGMPIDSVPSAKAAAQQLKAMGAANVLITLGVSGCVYTDGDGVCHRPAEKTVVVDTTSAGDCFVGGFVTKLSQGYTVAEAVDFASKAAAITVSRMGASASIPRASELTE